MDNMLLNFCNLLGEKVFGVKVLHVAAGKGLFWRKIAVIFLGKSYEDWKSAGIIHPGAERKQKPPQSLAGIISKRC